MELSLHHNWVRRVYLPRSVDEHPRLLRPRQKLRVVKRLHNMGVVVGLVYRGRWEGVSVVA